MRLAFCQAHKLVKLEGVFCMSNKTLFAIKKELSAKGVPFDDNTPIHELKKLFDSLPVTSGQIRELKLLGIDETGRLTEEAVVCPFVLNAEITMKEYITSIKNMYQEISDMNVGSRSVTANIFLLDLQALLT